MSLKDVVRITEYSFNVILLLKQAITKSNETHGARNLKFKNCNIKHESGLYYLIKEIKILMRRKKCVVDMLASCFKA